ncbi:MAG: efflux RND transporter permease subunit, partial [Planctomycetaceae bacterium]
SKTLVELLPATFWACVTTAVGFASLMSSEVTPVYSFGLMMMLAALLVLVAAVVMAPAGLLAVRFDLPPRDAAAEERLFGWLDQILRLINRRPVALAIGFAVWTAVSAVGLTRLTVEKDFSKNFRESSDIVQSLIFVEDRLGGAGTWEVNFPAPDRHEVGDEEFLRFLEQVRVLAERLRTEEPRLTKVVALTDGLDLVPQNFSLSQRLEMLDTLQPEFRGSLYNAEQRRMRIVLRAEERQPSDEKIELMHNVERIAQEEFQGAKATGLFVLLAFLIESIVGDQITSFSLAAAGIFLSMVIAFRSLRIALISIVPNIFPIVLVIGGMGWANVPVNIGTAMIASVSMGLTVDSTIHYLSAYRRARDRGLAVADALRDTQQYVGRALVFAYVALMIGFSVLAASHFIPLVYFGVLVSAAMLGGLVGDLVLLPLLLRYTERDADDNAAGAG